MTVNTRVTNDFDSKLQVVTNNTGYPLDGIRLAKFFSTARERYLIKLRREKGQTQPWTQDQTFQEWFFCNVHREDDKVTTWFRENIRNQVGGWRAVRACYIFRFFNRIETGEVLKSMLLSEKPFSTKKAYDLLKEIRPVTNAAYIVNSPNYMPKLEGILKCIEDYSDQLEEESKTWSGESLEEAWETFCELPHTGAFMAYEMVSDLRWTPVLRDAKDILSWANSGPGCARGLSWLTGCKVPRTAHLPLMRCIYSIVKENWYSNWKEWELREVEHWLCEFDKYCRARYEHRRLKRRYKR